MAKRTGKPREPDEIRPEDVAVGARIVAAREARGLSQADLARELGCPATTVWRYETGRMSARARLVEIGAVTGADPIYLERGLGDVLDERSRVVEDFIVSIGPTLKPPMTRNEARFLRAWPHHRVTHGKLLDALRDARSGMSAEESMASERATEEARAKGTALGVPARRAR